MIYGAIALNERPKSLGTKIGKEKQLPIAKLQQYDFNVKRHMGDLLEEKMHFDNFDELRKAYEAFDDRRIEHAFNDQKIKTANAIRNVLVHRAGIADSKFTERVTTDPRWSSVRPGEEIFVSGRDASDLTLAVIACISELIIRVDHWLSSNPE